MNFQEEVRAHRDLDSFLAQASILLDEKAATLDEVLRRMLTHVVEDGHGSYDVDKVMNSLFTDTGGKERNGEPKILEALWDEVFASEDAWHNSVKAFFFACSLKYLMLPQFTFCQRPFRGWLLLPLVYVTSSPGFVFCEFIYNNMYVKGCYFD